MKTDRLTLRLLASLAVAMLLIQGCGDGGGASVPGDGGTPQTAEDAGVNADAAERTDAGTTDSGTASDGGGPLPACAPMPLPTPCTSAATSALPSGAHGTVGTRAVTVETFDNPHASAPGKVSVYLPAGLPVSVPTLFFSHAFGATNPKSYDALFRMLASNGYAVVHVPYPNITSIADRYDCLWEGFVEATTRYPVRFDLTKVGFFGHSFGGGATPEMARRGFVEKGWGSAGRFMFMMAPWYSWGQNYQSLPTDVRTVVQVYADDDKNDHEIAVNDIWNKLPAGIERSWILVRSDACQCGLNAPHTLPMTDNASLPNPENVTNGYDTWGVWRRIHALASYAFAGDTAARPVAFGTESSMGAWLGCGGRNVRPLESGTTPITTTCQPFLYTASARCDNADPGTACP